MQDVNDMEPTFDQDNYTRSIYEDVEANFPVIDLNVSTLIY